MSLRSRRTSRVSYHDETTKTRSERGTRSSVSLLATPVHHKNKLAFASSNSHLDAALPLSPSSPLHSESGGGRGGKRGVPPKSPRASLGVQMSPRSTSTGGTSSRMTIPRTPLSSGRRASVTLNGNGTPSRASRSEQARQQQEKEQRRNSIMDRIDSITSVEKERVQHLRHQITYSRDQPLLNTLDPLEKSSSSLLPPNSLSQRPAASSPSARQTVPSSPRSTTTTPRRSSRTPKHRVIGTLGGILPPSLPFPESPRRRRDSLLARSPTTPISSSDDHHQRRSSTHKTSRQLATLVLDEDASGELRKTVQARLSAKTSSGTPSPTNQHTSTTSGENISSKMMSPKKKKKKITSRQQNSPASPKKKSNNSNSKRRSIRTMGVESTGNDDGACGQHQEQSQDMLLNNHKKEERHEQVQEHHRVTDKRCPEVPMHVEEVDEHLPVVVSELPKNLVEDGIRASLHRDDDILKNNFHNSTTSGFSLLFSPCSPESLHSSLSSMSFSPTAITPCSKVPGMETAPSETAISSRTSNLAEGLKAFLLDSGTGPTPLLSEDDIENLADDSSPRKSINNGGLANQGHTRHDKKSSTKQGGDKHMIRHDVQNIDRNHFSAPILISPTTFKKEFSSPSLKRRVSTSMEPNAQKVAMHTIPLSPTPTATSLTATNTTIGTTASPTKTSTSSYDKKMEKRRQSGIQRFRRMGMAYFQAEKAMSESQRRRKFVRNALDEHLD